MYNIIDRFLKNEPLTERIECPAISDDIFLKYKETLNNDGQNMVLWAVNYDILFAYYLAKMGFSCYLKDLDGNSLNDRSHKKQDGHRKYPMIYEMETETREKYEPPVDKSNVMNSLYEGLRHDELMGFSWYSGKTTSYMVNVVKICEEITSILKLILVWSIHTTQLQIII